MAPGAKRCTTCYARGAPRQIGDYTLLETLGKGAHGTVYKARQVGTGQLVALKVTGEPVREILSHVRLAHPNIVPIFSASGRSHDPPFFTMQLIEGGTLNSRHDDFSAPDRALELMIQVTDAVEHAHRHGVLHRDLKPTNILIDPTGRALVSDFSVAKEIGDAEPAQTATIAGTLPYMAPEQAGIVAAPVTPASDVYGLAAILYELLTGGPPRPVETLDELRASFAAADLPPRIVRRGVSADLAAVCMRGLSKDPLARYGSAALLAADLRCVRTGGWPPWRPPTVAMRLKRWVLRNVWVAVSIVLGALLLTAINVDTFNTVREQQAELQQIVLKSNAALAKAQAQAALAELAKLRDEVAQTVAASLPLLEAYLRIGREIPQRPELALAIPGFDSLFVAGCDGFIHAHSFDDALRKQFPNGPPGYFDQAYEFRDYFRGAVELGRSGSHEVYVSRAFRSTWDKRLKFALSTPIYAEQPPEAPCVPGTRMIGVFFAGRSASSTLGEVQISELGGSGQSTVLFGPRDRDRPERPLPAASAFHVVVHEKLRLGDERAMDRRLALRLSARFGPAAPAGRQFESPVTRPYNDSDYADTLDPHSRWLGGFYPVGRTGFVLGVQTAYGHAAAPVRRVGVLAALNVGFFVYCVAALWFSVSRRRGPSTARA